VGVLRDRVTGLTQAIEARTGPLLGRLRRSVIHGDANDHNVIVSGSTVSGFIDYGDIVHSLTVADPAIAIAYAALDERRPLAVARSIVSGYPQAHGLTETEIRALWDLVLLRLCMSVALAAHQQAQRPENDYLAISQAPIVRTLPRLAAIPTRFAEAALREACRL